MLNASDILASAQSLAPFLIDCYQSLHMIPELAHQEVETNAFLRRVLTEHGISYFAPTENITIACVTGKQPGAVVGIRCDTDALPVTEETGLPFASRNQGKMHACGHDGHMAMGLGVACLLQEHADEWSGTVKIIFQPAEEGEDGAKRVIATGLVSDVNVFFAIHLWSNYSTGTLHAAPVTTSAAVNMFEIRVHGKGGHGAAPDQCIDVLPAAAAIISNVQSILSRRISPMEPAVVTIGSIHAGTVGNIIAEDAVMKGTLRALNNTVRTKTETALETIVHSTAAAFNCTAEIINNRISDAVANDPRATAFAVESAKMLVPDEQIGGQTTMMIGDNFSDFGEIAPYCYMQLGIADKDKQTHYALHNSRFRLDTDVLPLGTAWLATAAMLADEKWNQP